MDNIDLKSGKPMMTSINSDDTTRLSNAKKIIREYASDYNEKDLNDFVEHNPEAQFIMAMEYVNGWNDGINTLASKYIENINMEMEYPFINFKKDCEKPLEDKYKIYEVNKDLSNTDEVYISISKEYTKDLFNEAGEIPYNSYGDKDESYIKGDIQYIFEKGTTNLDEILLFPIYEEEDSFINGEFINAPDSVVKDQELFNKVKDALSNH